MLSKGTALAKRKMLFTVKKFNLEGSTVKKCKELIYNLRGENALLNEHQYLWFEDSPYTGNGYKKGHAEGGHKTTDEHTT